MSFMGSFLDVWRGERRPPEPLPMTSFVAYMDGRAARTMPDLKIDRDELRRRLRSAVRRRLLAASNLGVCPDVDWSPGDLRRAAIDSAHQPTGATS